MNDDIFATKVQRLRDRLIEILSKNGFHEGDKFFTEKELCEKYRISRPTVREALALLVKKGYLTRQQGRGTFVRNTPVSGKAQKASTDKKYIAVAYKKSWKELPGDVALEKLIQGVDDVITPRGYFLQLIMLEENEERDCKLIESVLNAGNLAGMVIQGAPGPLARLLRDIPVVVEGNVVAEGFPVISRDAAEGAFLAIEHLIRLGHRRIGMVASNLTAAFQFGQFIEGYKKAFDKYSIKGNYQYIVRDVFDEDGCRLAKDLLQDREPPTAFFGTEWIATIGIFRAADELGLKVPDDISIVGYGDNALSWQHSPRLTAVGFSTREASRVAAEKLLTRIEGENSYFTSVVLPVKFFKGESTTPLRRLASV